jgi:hypothetical protein
MAYLKFDVIINLAELLSCWAAELLGGWMAEWLDGVVAWFFAE